MIERLLIPGVTFALACAATWTVRAVARRRELLDRPNARSAHVRPTPRIGGIGIQLSFLGAAFILARGAQAGFLVVLGATALVALVGLVDDLRGLPARARFAVQVLAASAVVGSRADALRAGVDSPLGDLPFWLLAPLLVLWIVWVTNLYNFMDGIDGLAGGQTVLASVAVALCAGMLGAGLTGTLALALGGAALGFLVFNFPPATIFMGDVGSTAIGFFLASVPLLPERRPVPVEAVALAIALFGLDATTTLVRRVLRGERWFEAHRTHLYQRPLACGVRHRSITLVAWAAMAIVAAGAAGYVRLAGPSGALLFLIPLSAFGAFALVVRRIESRAVAGRAGAEVSPSLGEKAASG